MEMMNHSGRRFAFWLCVGTVAVVAVGQPTIVQATSPEKGLDALVKAAKEEGTVMIYHTSAVATFRPVFTAFAQKYGITVRNFYATGTPLSVRFASEVAAGTIQADVFYASDPSIIDKYAADFQPLNDTTLPGYSMLPSTLRLKNGLAVSSVQLPYTLFYNTQKLSDADRPHTWADLANAKWKGQTLLIEPRSSLSFRAPYNVIRKTHAGILERIAANAPRIVHSGTAAVQQLAAGTGTIAFVGYPVHAEPLMKKGAPVRWAVIEGPAIARRTWIGAVRGPHPNAARLLVHYLTSIEGLKTYCASGDGSMAARDPTGRQTGCEPIADDVTFLPDTPMSAEESAATLHQLRLQ